MLLFAGMLAAGLIIIVRSLRSTEPRIGKSQNALQPALSQPPPTFMGANACAVCHQREFKQWTGSHHQLAMQPATDATVLGDFNQVQFTNGGVTSTFFRRGGKFMVRTDGPDGTLRDYEINYTFGLFPLQQYLIAMPGGRLQALGIAWDSRSHEHGGQRWFFLYPKQSITYRDTVHWTGIDQTWNFMCADCHSTNLSKNYDLRTRTFATTYAEINVACEACHGPGSRHVSWAKRQGDWTKVGAGEGLTVALDERRNVVWTIDPATGNPRRSGARESTREIQTCARCHSRRGQIHQDYVHGQPVGDDYRVALLDPDLYFPDGQIKGEVYEYGSFIQSRMFRAGVTCSDCHEPHSLRLRAEGNSLCLQCHSNRYDSSQHHFHKAGSAGAQCVACHMPTRTYMVIDARRDHSIRVPRPDLSLRIGTPNACNQCHTGKSPQWAADSLDKWYRRPPPGFQQFGETLSDGAEGAPGARQMLGALIANHSQPAIARGAAVSLLAAYAPSPTDPAVRAAVADDSSLVRRAVARGLSGSDPRASASTLGNLLNDPVRAVRIEAAEALAGAPPGALPSDLAGAQNRATAEYVAAQELNADRPEAHLNLALLFASEGKADLAERELRRSLSLDPSFSPAAVNLADLDRELGRETEGEAVLRQALQRSPDDASLLYALGLSMVRQKRSTEALTLFGKAASMDPGNSRYAYVYAIALNDAGQAPVAIETLERIVKLHPYDRASLAAVVTFCQQAGDRAKALIYARRLDEVDPGNPEVKQMLNSLSGQPHG